MRGTMVPLSAVQATTPTFGPQFTNRFNVYRAAQITGAAAPGYSSGQAMAALEEVARQTLPREIGYDWSDLSYQERQASGTTVMIFGLSLIFVFLILAALYESWSLPFSVLLTVPVAVFGAFVGLLLRKFDLDVYAQIGDHHADRPGGEERHPDRRVREVPARRRLGRGRGGARRRAAAAAADPDDVVRVHPRLRAAVAAPPDPARRRAGFSAPW